MLSFYDRTSLLGAPTLPLDPSLLSLLADCIEGLKADDLLDLTHLLIIQPGDTEEVIRAEVGFSPLIDPYDGKRFGSPGFLPWWDLLDRLDGWFRITVCVANDGFAFELFIQDDPHIDPELLALCRTYA